MRRYLAILPLLGVLACTGFDQEAAEEAIREIVAEETGRLTASEVSLDLAIPEADPITLDSIWLLTGITLTTAFESETLAIYFNQEFKGDTIVTVGDSAQVEVIRSYSGRLTSTLHSIEDGTPKEVSRDFTSERIQWVQFADNGGWEMAGYSIAEERSDTNTTQIFSLQIKGKGIDTTIYSSASLAGLEEFPKTASGTKLSLELRTVSDTNFLVSFALGSEAARFVPKQNEDEQWDDRWEAELTVGDDPAVVGVIRKAALRDSDYPADFDLWILPITE